MLPSQDNLLPSWFGSTTAAKPVIRRGKHTGSAHCLHQGQDSRATLFDIVQRVQLTTLSADSKNLVPFKVLGKESISCTPVAVRGFCGT